ncbi:MAG: helix-turn-helix domain-containing protein [Flavobacterium sp.]
MYQLRMEYTHKLILNTDIPLKEIANYCGYEHVQHFTTAFKRIYTPPALLYRK